jgi:D-galactarolactone cycloisomerase
LKITEIKTYPLRTNLEQPFAFSQGWVKQRSSTIVEIVTDEGITGWGESLCMGLQPPEIAAATIESALKPLLIGEDPSNTEVMWHRMYNHTRDYGTKGAMIGAISAIDIALWDIVGKKLNQPVYQLLGGAFRRKVQAYATGFYRISGQGEQERLAKEAETHMKAGFTAMKIKLGFGVEDDIRVMQAIRNAVGDDITLMIDSNHAYGVSEAIQLGLALKDYKLRWIEEPVVPEDIAGYKQVRNALQTSIAGGEGEYTVFGFRDLIGNRAIDIAQPDICHAGGFTACKHIAALAYAHGIQVNPHVWGSGIGQAASLHLLAALPVANYSLFAKQPIFEYDCSSHPFRSQLIKDPIIHKDGWIDIPEKPGIGIEVNRSVLEAYVV